MKSLYIIFVVLIGGIIITLIIFNKPSFASTTPKTNNTVWEVPVTSEVAMISEALENNEITQCLEFYVSQTEENYYLIACSKNGNNWTYYLFNKNQDTIQLLDKVESARLTSPNLLY